MQPTTTDQPSQPNRGGAPRGNSNRFKHGLRSALTLGSVPKRLAYVRRLVGELRRQLEAAATEVHGTLGPTHIAAINRATRYELVALYATRELRDQDGTLSLRDRLGLWDRLTAATEARDKALAQLGLSGAPGGDPDPWAAALAGVADGWAEHADGMHRVASSGRQAMEGSGDATEATEEGQSLQAGDPDPGSDRGPAAPTGDGTQQT